MISSFDPNFVLKVIEQIYVEIKFQYEQHDATTISHTSSDLFGDHKYKIELPYRFHYLEPEVVKVYFGKGKMNASMLSNVQLEHTLLSIQNYITQFCYNSAYVKLVVAYICKIDILINNLSTGQNLKILVINEQELSNRGYPPEFIDVKVRDFESQFSNQIKAKLVEPLQAWIKNLLIVVHDTESLVAIRKAIIEYTGIIPENKERRNKVEPSFTTLGSKKWLLPLIFEKLVEVGFIHKNTLLSDFIQIFSGDQSCKLIEWTGKIGDLKWFIKIINDKKVIRYCDTVSKTAGLLFTIEGKDVYKSLRGGKDVKESKRHNLILELLDGSRR